MVSKDLTITSSSRQSNWRSLYQNHLSQSLAKTIIYVKTAGTPAIKTHVISMLTLLEESLVYYPLNEARLMLINALHPTSIALGIVLPVGIQNVGNH